MSSVIWYWAAAASATACSVLAVVVVVAGWRRRLAEVAALGSSLLAVSALPLAHALGGTGLLGGPPGSGWATSMALVAASLAALPLIGFVGVARWWREWVVATSAASTVAALALVGNSTSPSAAVAGVLLSFGVIGMALLMRRQWVLYRIGRLRGSLVALVAIGTITTATVTAHLTSPGSTLSWLVLTIENVGVFAASIAVLAGYRVDRNVADVLAPIASREPLTALEVGLSPEVHAFVAALGRKDQITRDHVVRTSALALRVAIRAGLDHDTSRQVALGALLHDIGKLVVPSDLLNKPAALTDDEFAMIKSHPEAGERLLEHAPSLEAAARFVRWHHERFDGRGYPDRLSGDEITLEVGIVSAVDAWDAMTNTRQYRVGMSRGDATRILLDGAGTQWHPDAVRLLLEEVRRNPDVDEFVTRSGIGHRGSDGCSCLDEVLRDCVVAVDGDVDGDVVVWSTASAADGGTGGADEIVDAGAKIRAIGEPGSAEPTIGVDEQIGTELPGVFARRT